MKKAIAAILVVFGIVGCKNQSEPAAGVSPTSRPNSTTPAAPKTVDPDMLDGSLKNDAFSYYGIGSPKAKKYKLQVQGAKPSVSEQSVTIKITSTSGKLAEVTEEDSGGAVGDSTQVMNLKPDGLYVESVQPQVLKTPNFLEMPSPLKVGTTWKNHQGIDAGSASLDENLTFKVVDAPRITTPAGTFQTLHLVGTGSGNISNTPTKIRIEAWYAKDTGLIKQSAQIKGKGMDTTVTQVLTSG